MREEIDDELTVPAHQGTGATQPALGDSNPHGHAVAARTFDALPEAQRTSSGGARQGGTDQPPLFRDDVTIEYDLTPPDPDRWLGRGTLRHEESVGETQIPRSDVLVSEQQPSATFRLAILPRPLNDDAPGPPSGKSGARFEARRTLGVGSSGEVRLEYDHDIGRTVAVKRLRGPHAPEALLRFTEEVRTIGGLEHPNIVPIHDVGIDEQQRYYFVMKYLDGETLESIIKRLAAGDPAYERRFTHARRADICLEIMNAVAYAHARGIIHRDIKPANIMVGRYGEVLVMDWGVAKKIRKQAAAAPQSAPVQGAPMQGAPMQGAAIQGAPMQGAPMQGALGDASAGPVTTEDARLFTTTQGALIGTPLYMSPEQANAQNEAIDERSDIYSLSVMFHELFSLRHYLASETELLAVLAQIVKPDDRPLTAFVGDLFQATFPCEIMHFVRKGMRKHPAERYQSMAEMIEAFQQTRSGTFKIQCYYTLIKRGAQGVLHFVDDHPIFVTIAFVTMVLSVPLCVVLLLSRAL